MNRFSHITNREVQEETRITEENKDQFKTMINFGPNGVPPNASVVFQHVKQQTVIEGSPESLAKLKAAGIDYENFFKN